MPEQDVSYMTMNIFKDNGQRFLKQNFSKIDQIQWLVMRYYNSVINFQNFFRQHNIKYLLYNGLETDINTNKKDNDVLESYIDKKHFFGWNDSSLVHYNFCKANNIILENDGHASEQGVIQYSKLLIDYIQKQQLL